MTEIKVDYNDERIFISVVGHNRNSKICAMISALVAALDGFCESYFKDIYSYFENDAEARLNMPIKARPAAEMFCIGVLRLEKTYPENVKTEINI